MAEMKTSGPEGLAVIESMLKDIGAPNPAQQIKQQKKGAASPAKKQATANGQAKDCLAGESRQTFQTPKFDEMSKSRSRLENSSIQRGAHMAGKDVENTRFYGKGFTQPPRESPGPIYQPMYPESGSNQGRSFSRVKRMPDYTQTSVSAGPDQTLPGTIGNQVESTHRTASSVSFTRGKRFNQKEFISRVHGKNTAAQDTPAPTAYQSDVVVALDKKKGISFSGSRSTSNNKVFISRAHVVDSVGSSSPGPCYNPGASEENGRSASAFAVLDSKHRKSPAFSFGKNSGPMTVEEEGNRPRSVQPFISREHSKSTPSLDNPGPAAYSPSIEITKKNIPHVSFCKDHGTEKRFISKDLSTSKGKESPGPKYFYDDNVTRKNAKTATLGPLTGEISQEDRFGNKVFIGKGMGEIRGGASPGPAYNPTDQQKGPSFTLVHKERHFPKSIFPGPSRTRFIMKDLAKENMGAYSPGPKYDTTTKQFGSSAPAVSFGTSDKYFGEGFSEEHRAKFGTAEKPYTCPAEARFVSREFSKSAMAGKCSSGPKYSPKDEICSSTKRQPSAIIAADVGPSISRKKKVEESAPPQQTSVTHAKYDVVDHDKRAHAFPKAERMPAGRTQQGPGPWSYNPKHDLVERTFVKNVSIGELA